MLPCQLRHNFKPGLPSLSPGPLGEGKDHSPPGSLGWILRVFFALGLMMTFPIETMPSPIMHTRPFYSAGFELTVCYLKLAYLAYL